MVELDGHYAVVAEDSVVFGEGEGHFCFVVLVGEFFGADAHVAEAGWICNSFTIFIGEV